MKLMASTGSGLKSGEIKPENETSQTASYTDGTKSDEQAGTSQEETFVNAGYLLMR